MIDLKDTVEQIEKLLLAGTARDLTYAALECRLAIERICYERLRLAHDYISRKELKNWQPKHVVDFVVRMADEQAAATATLSISRMPVPDGVEVTKDFFAEQEYVEVGTQIGFDPRALGRLWNALAGVALHSRLPENDQDWVGQYGESEVIRPKVEEALATIKKVSAGTISMSGVCGTISFECGCGLLNKRTEALLKDKQVVSCANPKCYGSYTYHAEDSSFEQRLLELSCTKCDAPIYLRRAEIYRLELGKIGSANCTCGERTFFEWRLYQGKSKPSFRAT